MKCRHGYLYSLNAEMILAMPPITLQVTFTTLIMPISNPPAYSLSNISITAITALAIFLTILLTSSNSIIHTSCLQKLPPNIIYIQTSGRIKYFYYHYHPPSCAVNQLSKYFIKHKKGKITPAPISDRCNSALIGKQPRNTPQSAAKRCA